MTDMYVITTDNAPSIVTETVVDGWLSEEDIAVLYKRWRETWPAPLEFSGGVQGITCEAIEQVPQAQLNRTYGKIRGQKFMKIAKENSNA